MQAIPLGAASPTLPKAAIFAPVKRPRREFKRVSEPLSALLSRFDPEGRMRVYQLWDFWDAVVGAAIAERAQPQRIHDGILFVQVATHTWMQELQFLKEDIRTRLNDRLGAALISDLRFVLGRIPRRRAEPPEPLPVPVAVPDLPPTGTAEIDDVLRRIATAAARRRAQAEPRRKRRKG